MSKLEDKVVIPTIPPEQLLTPEQLRRLHEPVPPGTPLLSDVIAEIVKDTPPEEWAKLPRDLSKNLDHYLYGAPKERDTD